MGAPMPRASAGGGLVTDDEVRGPRVDPRPGMQLRSIGRTGVELIGLEIPRLP